MLTLEAAIPILIIVLTIIQSVTTKSIDISDNDEEQDEVPKSANPAAVSTTKPTEVAAKKLTMFMSQRPHQSITVA